MAMMLPDPSQRCDFKGLFTYGKVSVPTSGSARAVQEAVLPSSLMAQLRKQSAVSADALMQFAMHNLLNVYGNGNHTFVGSARKDGCTTIFLDHQEIGGQSAHQVLHSIQRDLQLGHAHTNTSHTLDACITIQRGTSNGLRLPTAPLLLTAHESLNGDGGWKLELNYDETLIDSRLAADFLHFLQTLLNQLVVKIEQRVSELELLSAAQLEEMLAWNQLTDGQFPSDLRLNQLFEEATVRAPDRVAVVHNEIKLTYRQLNERANQVAHHLHHTLAMQPEQLIALCLDRHVGQIATVLGVWKSGAAYIPIDPSYPDERILFTMQDTAARFILTDSCHASRVQSLVSSLGVKVLVLESILSASPESRDWCNNLSLPLNSTQLAYVTYTSGTTGVPKGVYKEHRGVVNSITDLSAKYEMTASEVQERVVLFSAYVFEPFVRQTLIALINSHQLILVDEQDKLDERRFVDFIQRHHITYLNGTASVLQEYDFSACPTLSRLLLVGEEFTEARCTKLRETYRGRIISEYGFTESALVTAMKVFEVDTPRNDRSIGRPLRNVKCYILNSNMQKVPVGAIGQLHIGGLGVSRGYMNRAKLTADKFLPNPFQTEQEARDGVNSKMYATGDLARWLPSGQVEYIGRTDFQIKLRGIRIEPGEIESILTACDGVDKCAVIAVCPNGQDEAKKQLVGYFVAEPQAVVHEEELMAVLEAKLPRYMVPARLMQIDKIPVTINGKLDMRALPKPECWTRPLKSDGQRPLNEIEKVLCELWSHTLGIPLCEIGPQDDFLRLGGHSITCIQLLGRIRQRLGCTVDVDTLFTLRTIERLAQRLQSATNGNCNSQNKEQGLADADAGSECCQFLANSLQQGLVFQYLRSLDSGMEDDSYVLQNVYEYSAELNLANMKRAWRLAPQQFPALRLRFALQDGEIVQIVDPVEEQRLQSWTWVDLSYIAEDAEQEKQLRRLEKADRCKAYRLLENGGLFRVYLFRLRRNVHRLLFSCHHSILDGWSMPVLLDFVHQAYYALCNGEEVAVRPDKTYCKAQVYLERHRTDHTDFWNGQLAGISTRCDMSSLLNEASRSDPDIQLTTYDHIKEPRELRLSINEESCRLARSFCTSHGVTLHTLLQFVWHKVLYSYGGGFGQAQTVVGTVLSGRHMPVDHVDSSVGMFVNTLPLIVKHGESTAASVLEAIQAIQSQVNAMNSRSGVVLAELGGGSGLKHGLFDCLFVLENYPQRQSRDYDQLLGFRFLYDVEKLDYPLVVVVRHDTAGGLEFRIKYAGELIEEHMVNDMLSLVQHLLHQVINVDRADMNLADLCCVTPKHRVLLDTWNQTRDDRMLDAAYSLTLHAIFEEEAARSPSKLALVFKERQLSYKQLNEAANLLAHHLRGMGAGPGQLVALFMDKTDYLIVSILAVWKSGAAYVPIDPSYPNERILFMLQDTQASIVLMAPKEGSEHDESSKSEEWLRKQSLSPPPTVVHVDALLSHSHLAIAQSLRNPNPLATSRDLAYIIYTSGTTGNPKGVMVEHCGVVNLQQSLASIFNLRAREDEVIMSFSNVVFDHFVEQMVDALLNGQTLVVLPDSLRTDKDGLAQYMAQHRVTYVSGTPSVLSLYDFGSLPSLRRIDGVGEDFSSAIYRKIRSSFDGLIINGYGPTEVSITTHKRLYELHEDRTNKSIGSPVANTTTYVLDSNMRQVPVGALGELYIGGVGVDRGYLNRPQLTQERFLPNPFASPSESYNDRLYKTGDLVRFLRNGEIEYLGRTDLQVKINGVRIEIGEIENVLLGFDGISAAAVVLASSNGAGKNQLVAYYVSESPLNAEHLTEHINNKLPSSMRPHLVRISEMPLTKSGKVDSRRLPQFAVTPVEVFAQPGAAAPTNHLQERIVQIYAQLLTIPSHAIGVGDDFFKLGGDSLLAIRLSIELNKVFGVTISVAHVFRLRTILKLSQHIEAASNGASKNQLKMGEEKMAEERLDEEQRRQTDTCLSFGQERLLFTHELMGGDLFNVVFCVKVSSNVDKAALKRSILGVIARHEALRTLIVTDDVGRKRLHVLRPEHASSKLVLNESVVHSAEHLNSCMLAASKWHFALERELPIRVDMYEWCKSDNNTRELFIAFVFHHICFDGWSWSIFQRDLRYFYDLFTAANASTNSLLQKSISAPPPQYSEFAGYQRRSLKSDKTTRLQLQYWTQKLASAQHTLNLITDYQRPAEFPANSGADLPFEVSHEVATKLRALARELHVSLFSVLLSAYCLTLEAFTGQTDMLVGIPTTTRAITPGWEDTIGFFVDLLVVRVRNNINNNNSIAEVIQAVATELVEAQRHQTMPFDKIVHALKLETDLSRHPLVQTVFNYNPVGNPDHHEENSSLQLDEIELKAPCTVAKYDLALTMSDSGPSLKGHLNFPSALFRVETIESILHTFLQILKCLSAKETHIDCHALRTATSAQPSAIPEPVKYNELVDRYSPSNTLSTLFEETVKQNPDSVALVSTEMSMTYMHLNCSVNQLAAHLRSVCAIGPEKRIALLLDKSPDMVVSMLAVWKAGGVCVPLDVGWPADRIRLILQDTSSQVVLTNQRLFPTLQTISSQNAQIISVDDPDTRKLLQEQSTENTPCHLEPHHLAYIIYTSGSTGKPKGVMVEHMSVVQLHSSLKELHFGKKNSERQQQQQGVLFTSNYVFDFSIEQFLLSIFSGHKLILPPEGDALNIDDHFYQYANAQGLTYLSGTPTLLSQFDTASLSSLHTLTVAGEEFQAHHYHKLRRHFAGVINNAYGTTETTVYNMIHQFRSGDSYSNNLGKTLPGTTAYVLNDEMQEVGVGSVGQLCLGGPCLSRGYLNQPQLTANNFRLKQQPKTNRHKDVQEEAHDGSKVQLYLTGDLVRRTADGRIEFLGRRDRQVKLRGLRVELGEIESTLALAPGVRQCAVLVRERETKLLVAYFVPAQGYDVAIEELRAFIQQRLPSYMVPSHFVTVQGNLPTTATGKLDVQRLVLLPIPQDSNNAYAAPRDQIESTLCSAWACVLNLPDSELVGIDDDFFKLGGDSILLLQLVAHIQATSCSSLQAHNYHKLVRVKDIFINRTVRKLVQHLRTAPASQPIDAHLHLPEQGRLSGTLPLLPIQSWYFSQEHKNGISWNQRFKIHVPHQLDPVRLRKSVHALIEHHDAFRLGFLVTQGNAEAVQYYDDSAAVLQLHEYVIRTIDQSNEDESKRLREWESNIDMGTGQLAVFGYISGYADGSSRVWIAMHHLITDTVSWRVIAQHLQRLYNGDTLGPKKTSYRQWTQFISTYNPREELAHWQTSTEGVEAFNRSLLKLVPPNAIAQRVSITLNKNDTLSLLRLGSWNMKDILLTAFCHSVQSVITTVPTTRLDSASPLYLTLEGHGREDLHPALQLAETVGWFTTMFPFQVQLCQSASDSVQRVRQALDSVSHNGVGFGALFGYTSPEKPLPRIAFNYLGHFGGPDLASSNNASNAMWKLEANGEYDPSQWSATQSNVIDLTSWCAEGQLHATITAWLPDGLPHKLAEALKKELLLIGNNPAMGVNSSPRNWMPFEAYVELATQNESAPTLFMLPPGEGGAESYFNNLVPLLEAHFNLVLFNNIYIHHENKLDSFGSLADYYIEHLERIRPTGPYHLLGWSFGGVLALEIAHKLANTGKQGLVANLFLIDSYFNVAKACAEIGLGHETNILDPINHKYEPSMSEVEGKLATGSITLFKMGLLNEMGKSEEQVQLFKHFQYTDCNHLDTIISAELFRVVSLPTASHNSWALDKQLLALICDDIKLTISYY